MVLTMKGVFHFNIFERITISVFFEKLLANRKESHIKKIPEGRKIGEPEKVWFDKKDQLTIIFTQEMEAGKQGAQVCSLSPTLSLKDVYGTSKLPKLYSIDFKLGLYCCRWLQMSK